jgi:hypothetical protein
MRRPSGYRGARVPRWLERRRHLAAAVGTEIVELVTPRTNAAIITPAEHLLAAIALRESFSFEIAVTKHLRRFLVRAGSERMRRHLEGQLGAAYPQADIRGPDVAWDASLDPAHCAADEQVAKCALVLRAPAYLPIRLFRDTDVDATHAPQADPVLGILGSLLDLPVGWRALSQLVLSPARDDWCKPYLRMAVEHPLEPERAASLGRESSSGSFIAPVALLTLLVLGLQSARWYAAGQWLSLAAAWGGLGVVVPGLVLLIRHLQTRPIYDMALVREKTSRVAFYSEIRLSIFARTGADRVDMDGWLERFAAAYRPFNLAAGNSVGARALPLDGRDLRTLLPIGPRRRLAVLTTRELAGLWHLPQADADVALVERTTARRHLPLPTTVRDGCRIGRSTHQGHRVDVALPVSLLQRHLLLVAKTRRGKSSLLLRLAQHLMHASSSGRRRMLLIVDPHRDLARAALGLVPPARHPHVVYLDVAEGQRPFGLNLLDLGLGWQRDQAVSNVLAVFRREFDEFWGPRMEDAFRFAALTLLEANAAICNADPNDGRGRQHTLLELPEVLAEPAFRRQVLAHVTDPVIKRWSAGYWDQLDRRFQLEIQIPVATKIHRYSGSRAASAVVGQPRSTVDPSAWLRDGAIVIVNTAKDAAGVGEDTAALVGASLLNLVALAIGGQAPLPAEQRNPATLIVDEFQTMPGADYQGILAELAKYGANLVLATQSLANLVELDRTLRPMVFSNIDGLFAFQTSAEDARYLAPELGAHIDEQDLVELDDFHCYARVSRDGARLPTFSVQLDPPPQPDSVQSERLATVSAERYGRKRDAVEADIRSAIARIEHARQAVLGAVAGQAWTGVPTDGGASSNGHSRNRPPRNAHRPARKGRPSGQKPLFEPGGGTGAGADAAPEVDRHEDPDPSDPEEGEAA